MANTVRRRTRELGTITTTVEHKQSGVPVSAKENIEHTPVEEDVGEHPGYVMVKGAATKNIGDYNSVGVQVSIGMPCRATMEAAKEKYEEISAVVDDLVRKELMLATGAPEETVNV